MSRLPLDPLQAGAPGLASAYGDEGAVPVFTALVAPLPLPTPSPRRWEDHLDIGLDGSEGNSVIYALHLGAKLKRKSEFKAYDRRISLDTGKSWCTRRSI